MACVIADTAMPLLIYKTDIASMEQCLETGKEVEKGVGEEKSETDKLFGQVGIYVDFKAFLLERQFFEYAKLAKNALKPPILTPPPRLLL